MNAAAILGQIKLNCVLRNTLHMYMLNMQRNFSIHILINLEKIKDYPYYDLLGLKSMSEIIIDEINQNKNYGFYCVKEHLKTCKVSQNNSLFYQEFEKVNLNLNWDINKKVACKISSNVNSLENLTETIIKFKQGRGQKCGECLQFQDNLIKHDLYNCRAGMNCYENLTRKQVEGNGLQISCQNCGDKLTQQLIQKTLNHRIASN